MRSRIAAVLASTLLCVLVLLAPAHAAFPGANGKIAFTKNLDGNYEIYVMNADGTGQTRLTNSDTYDADPAWSPDADRVLALWRSGQCLHDERRWLGALAAYKQARQRR
jgi:hypothetical protein